MLQISPQTRILLATEPVDFRKGIDGLAAVCRRVLTEQPLSSTLSISTGLETLTIQPIDC
jgi:hypothetical protein